MQRLTIMVVLALAAGMAGSETTQAVKEEMRFRNIYIREIPEGKT